jgi:phosphonate ABC transporter permease subunit PhnE
MENKGSVWSARVKAFALDWLICAYVPAAVVYFFRSELKGNPNTIWFYMASVLAGLVVALLLERGGTSLGERIAGLVPVQNEVEGVAPQRVPWFRTQIGIVGLVLAIVTMVLGWNITEINLYYVFTRADRMANMTDRLFRPYWAVFPALIEKMIETIFLALMATVISVPIAAVLSFLAARNLMQRVTAPYASLATGFVGAVAGILLGNSVATLALGPLANTGVDVALVTGIVRPLLIIIGLVAGVIALTRIVRRVAGLEHPRGGRIAVILLTAILGTMAAYALASLSAMVLFAASWSIFVREYSPWPYVLLAIGALVGALLGARQKPAAEFPVGQVIYGIMRFVMNVTRSIEPFVWALIFVTWFRLGPFPGMVALMVHSIAALGKLYSEQIEGIDPGPLEAVRATGANELQTVVYAVVPQIIPPFVSFTIYRWDINVRMSTIIGLVGGGGVGQLLFQYQNLGQWRSVSVAVILIVAVVMTLDSISARIREHIL